MSTFTETTTNNTDNFGFSGLKLNNDTVAEPQSKKTTEILLRRFSPVADLSGFFSAFIIGPRESGKTWLRDDLTQYTVDNGYLLIENEVSIQQSFPTFGGLHFSTDSQLTLCDRMKSFFEQVQTKEGAAVYKNIILDGIYDRKFWKLPEISQLISDSHKYNACIFAEMQYVCDIPPSVRCSVDYVFARATQVEHHLERLYKHYFDVFPTFEHFKAAMKAVCNKHPYAFMVIDCRIKAKGLESVYWYVAKNDDDTIRVVVKDK